MLFVSPLNQKIRIIIQKFPILNKRTQNILNEDFLRIIRTIYHNYKMENLGVYKDNYLLT